MRLDRAVELINACAEQMNSRYQGIVFDEWAILSIADEGRRLLAYTGPRKHWFQKSFLADAGTLRDGLVHVDFGVGDFEFARHVGAPLFGAFMVVGRGLYLICNNTVQNMDALTQRPLWLSAQVAFLELSERFRANPLEVARVQALARARA